MSVQTQNGTLAPIPQISHHRVGYANSSDCPHDLTSHPRHHHDEPLPLASPVPAPPLEEPPTASLIPISSHHPSSEPESTPLLATKPPPKPQASAPQARKPTHPHSQPQTQRVRHPRIRKVATVTGGKRASKPRRRGSARRRPERAHARSLAPRYRYRYGCTAHPCGNQRSRSKPLCVAGIGMLVVGRRGLGLRERRSTLREVELFVCRGRDPMEMGMGRGIFGRGGWFFFFFRMWCIVRLVDLEVVGRRWR